MEKLLYTGIDQHKRTSTLVTTDTDGTIVNEAKLKNNPDMIAGYFRRLPGRHVAVVETTSGWYWLNDLLQNEGIELKLAHAKMVKAIAYAKVKTDKADAATLAQLLRAGLIPEAHKIDRSLRDERDALRTRLRLVEKHGSALNSVHRLLEKFNAERVEQLSDFHQLQAACHLEQADLIEAQRKNQERELNQPLVPHPGIGRINAFTIVLEVGGIDRFPTPRHFNSYCRLVPGSSNSGGKSKHQRSKDGNKYLKLAFSHAALRAIQYYPEIRKYYQRVLRRKNKMIARTLVAKELSRIVFFVLQKREPFNGMFKGVAVERVKDRQWPRLASPAV